MNPFLSLLQFSDGLFPAGAYAHSFGLEYSVQAGHVNDPSGVESFLRAYLQGSAAPADAVAVLCAGRAAARGDLAACLDLDETLDAMKAVAELRDASRQMGRQTLRVVAQFAPGPLLEDFSKSVSADATPGHHALVFGMIGGSLGWNPLEMTEAYLYTTTAAVVGASLRLLPLGQLAGQRILWGLRPLIAALAADAQTRNEADMWSFTPVLEIAGARHALLDARLFRS